MVSQNLVLEQSPLEFPSDKSEYRSDYISVHDLVADRARFERTISRFLKAVSKYSLSPKSTFNLLPQSSPLTLAEFFETTPRPLAVLMRISGLKRYLCRPLSEVEFTDKSYTPIFSQSEQRIYNLAAAQNEFVPYRYSRKITASGDSIPPEPGKENIGHYFGTRRCDNSVTDILMGMLEAEAENQNSILPVHVMNRFGKTIPECLRYATQHTKATAQNPQCYIIQRRHGLGGDGLHFGTLLAILSGNENRAPLRLIFFDTIRLASGCSPWEQGFKDEIDGVFQSSIVGSRVSEMAEDGGVNLWRPRDNTEMRDRDIDCSFYTFVMARALIQIACTEPDLLLNGSVDQIRTVMTGLMPEYFVSANNQKSPDKVREAGIVFRWQMGQDYLKAIEPAARQIAPSIAPTPLTDLSKLPYPAAHILHHQQEPASISPI
jgi:hypothetical protein